MLISFIVMKTKPVTTGPFSPYPVRCILKCMSVKIPADVRHAIREIAREFGRQGGKKAARNSTPEERSARAKKASLAAAKKRTEKRLAKERQGKAGTKTAKRK